MTLSCPSCNSNRIWRDGIRQTRDGDVQRYICRECGYRFSETHTRTESTPGLLQESSRRQIETAFNGSGLSEGHQRIHTNTSYRSSTLLSNRQICVTQSAGAKNLAKQISRTRKAAGATKPDLATLQGKIVEFTWWLNKKGRKPGTIKIYGWYMKFLVKNDVNIFNPSDVENFLAKISWTENRKYGCCEAYKAFLRMLKIEWEDPPSYKVTQKHPFIPTEQEIDRLIAASGKKLATALQTAKETAMRLGEIARLKWTDIDFERNIIICNNPEKNSLPRTFKVSSRLIAMINALPRKAEYSLVQESRTFIISWPFNANPS